MHLVLGHTADIHEIFVLQMRILRTIYTPRVPLRRCLVAESLAPRAPATLAGEESALPLSPGTVQKPCFELPKQLNYRQAYQRLKLPPVLTGELRRYQGCKVVQKTTQRKGPIKVAIIFLSRDVGVEEDYIFNYEHVIDVVLNAENGKIGVMSVYFEGHVPIGPYFDCVRCVCLKHETEKMYLGGDVNAWRCSEGNDVRGVDICNILDAEGLHILTEGNTLTFDVHWEDRLFQSVVDVTTCSTIVLDRTKRSQEVEI
ncbi:hypothetical protein EVAR_100103_1 [Eumeta japonica]|uniref:Endonuclease/exonuclease/phosphatase domain-containing protein n=1 Tax=Eumeta variegata TaxID=151549 RepID=A0A4C1YRN5_EUMVA|nr:hypothetical protein EVAR_100103_1 [Eumeta japonica]